MAPPDADALLSHAGFVRDLAFRLLRDAHEAEDVVQQVFLAAMRSPPEADRPLRPWLKRVARNLAIDAHRSRGRRQLSERVAAHEDALCPAGDSTALESAKSELAASVLSLAEPYRTVILLRFYDELSPRAIARRLDVPVETVRTRIKRGVALLRGRLHGDDDEKRGFWAIALVRLTTEPSASVTKPARWKTLVNVSAAAAIGALCVWLWSAERLSTKPSAEVARAAPDRVDPLSPAHSRGDARPDEATHKSLPPVEEARLLRVRIVTDEGVIVPDARVDIFADGTKVAESRTDRNGEIEVSRRPGTDLEIRVGMTRISLACSAEVPGSLVQSTAEPTVVRVPAASSVSGRVVDAEGFAVPYARVVGWFGQLDDERGVAPDQRCVADRNGQFTLLGLPHHFRVEAFWAHLVARETFVAHLEHATELKDIELHVCEPRIVRGQLLDEFGIAVSDAIVRTESAEDERLGSDADTTYVPRDGDVAISGADGTFVITGLAGSGGDLVVEHPDHAPHVIPSPPPDDTDPDETVEIGLEVGVGLDVWVTDGHGRAVANAAARFFAVSGSLRRATADASGRIHFDHMPSDAAGFLRVDARELEPEVREIKKLGKKNVRLEVNLSQPRVVRGYVHDAGHRPIRGAAVTARLADPMSGPEDPAWRAARNAASLLGEDIATGDGLFAFPSTPWRVLFLEVRTPQGQRRTFNVDYDQVIVECAFDANEFVGPGEAR